MTSYLFLIYLFVSEGSEMIFSELLLLDSHNLRKSYSPLHRFCNYKNRVPFAGTEAWCVIPPFRRSKIKVWYRQCDLIECAACENSCVIIKEHINTNPKSKKNIILKNFERWLPEILESWNSGIIILEIAVISKNKFLK